MRYLTWLLSHDRLKRKAEALASWLGAGLVVAALSTRSGGGDIASLLHGRGAVLGCDIGSGDRDHFGDASWDLCGG